MQVMVYTMDLHDMKEEIVRKAADEEAAVINIGGRGWDLIAT